MSQLIAKKIISPPLSILKVLTLSILLNTFNTPRKISPINPLVRLPIPSSKTTFVLIYWWASTFFILLATSGAWPDKNSSSSTGPPVRILESNSRYASETLALLKLGQRFDLRPGFYPNHLTDKKSNIKRPFTKDKMIYNETDLSSIRKKLVWIKHISCLLSIDWK